MRCDFRFWLTLGLFISLFPISAAHANDELFAEQIKPWKSIGRVNKDGGYCTGILVAKDKVLTAAHCLWNIKTNNWVAPELLHFLPGYNKGQYEGHATGVSYILPEKFEGLTTLKEIDRSQDWAVLTINRDLGEELGWLGIKSENLFDASVKGKTVSQAGYSKDFEYVLTGDKDCEIKNVLKIGVDLSPVYHHSCNTGRGDAGAPILIEEDGEYKIVGIHSSTIKRWKKTDISIAIPGHSFANFIFP